MSSRAGMETATDASPELNIGASAPFPKLTFDNTAEKTIMNTRHSSVLLAAMLAGAVSGLVVGCKGEPGPPPPATTVGTVIDDSMVTTKVKSALLADADVKSSEIKVETRKGEVQLSGFADNQTQIDRAGELARGVEGVKSVHNGMSLKDGKPTVGTTVDDSIITARVKSALLADANIKSLDIAVATSKGEVQLSGYVDNRTQIDRAVEVTRAVDGVKNIDSKMDIKK